MDKTNGGEELPAKKMPRFKITTPVKEFQGIRCGVTFSNGVGFTDESDAAWALVGIGYAVTDTRP
jgi:hypothetical protein